MKRITNRLPENFQIFQKLFFGYAVVRSLALVKTPAFMGRDGVGAGYRGAADAETAARVSLVDWVLTPPGRRQR